MASSLFTLNISASPGSFGCSLAPHYIVVGTYRENSETFEEPSKSISEELNVSLECYCVLAWASLS